MKDSIIMHSNTRHFKILSSFGWYDKVEAA